MPFATFSSQPEPAGIKSLRSYITLPLYRKAWSAPSVLTASPITWPKVSMPQASLPVPPSVPRSSVAGLMGLFGAVRKAWKSSNTVDASNPDHSAEGVDAVGLAIQTAEGPQVIGSRIDGTVRGSAKGVYMYNRVVDEGNADYLAGDVDSERLAVETAECPQV